MKENVVLEGLINIMLKKYNVDYDYIVKNQTIEGLPWFEYYTFTTLENDFFERDAKVYLKSKFKRWSKKTINREFNWFRLMWGLKIKD